MITLLLTFLALSPSGVARLLAGILGMTLEPALLLPALTTASEQLAGTTITATDPYVQEAGAGIGEIFVAAGLNNARGRQLLTDIVRRLTALAPAP
jgi:hypothetical protein